MSGTGDPGATITVAFGSDPAGADAGATATVGPDGGYSTAQLAGMPADTTSITVTQNPTAGASTTTTVPVAVEPGPSTTIPVLGSVTVTGVAGAGIEVETDQGDDVAATIGPSGTVTVDGLSIVALGARVRYADSSGRYGPWAWSFI